MNTNYIPLYRKYRPQAIEQIVGQEHIKKALANAIQMNRISHAYLFTGPRGTGKTSTARIFAKSLNCVNGPTITPCNECENCRNITNSIPIDVIEIDAASNRSVSDADDIIQKVALAPVQSRYKIYIIDEVHMLTNQAFNALLKTLEEPPKNVIFILATTEVHKVLDTIKSRCQRFDFKRITTDDIAKHLRYIADNEKINISDDALFYIAQNSAGGMRDSIALLDQLSILNSSKEAISVNDINSMLGRLSFDSLTALFKAIAQSNQNDALITLNEIYNKGNEPLQILSNLLEYLRNALILSTAKEVDSTVVNLNNEQKSALEGLLNEIEAHQIISLINKCSEYIKELKLTANPKLWLDVAILDMANLTQNTKLEDIQHRLSLIEGGEGQKLVNSSPYNTPPQPVKKVASSVAPSPKPLAKDDDTKQPVIKNSDNSQRQTVEDVTTDSIPMSKSASNSNSNSLKNSWVKLLENISSFPSRAILKQQAVPVKITSDEVIISIKNPSWLKQFGQDGSKHSFIVEAVNSMFDKTVSKVLVREPLQGDEAIRKEQQGDDDEKPAPAAKKEPQKQVPTKEELDEAVTSKNEINIEQKPHSHKKSGDEFNHSDNVNMVMELFEGKLIE